VLLSPRKVQKKNPPALPEDTGRKRTRNSQDSDGRREKRARSTREATQVVSPELMKSREGTQVKAPPVNIPFRF